MSKLSHIEDILDKYPFESHHKMLLQAELEGLMEYVIDQMIVRTSNMSNYETGEVAKKLYKELTIPNENKHSSRLCDHA